MITTSMQKGFVTIVEQAYERVPERLNLH